MGHRELLKMTSYTILTSINHRLETVPKLVKLRMANEFEANMPITVSFSSSTQLGRRGKRGHDSSPNRLLPCSWDGWLRVVVEEQLLPLMSPH